MLVDVDATGARAVLEALRSVATASGAWALTTADCAALGAADASAPRGDPVDAAAAPGPASGDSPDWCPPSP